MPRDAWNPDRYERFKQERSAPFCDLLALVVRVPEARVVDLGAGTGELTRRLHEALGARETLGLDSSAAMLERAAAFAGGGLRFELGAIEAFDPAPGSLDVIFSNAALHWVDDHERLFARLAAALAPGGQLAVQMPANHHHVSFGTAAEVAREAPFAAALGGHVRRPPVREPAWYAERLYTLGFTERHVRLQVYGHVLGSREDVVEWVRGTTLTDYERRLPAELWPEFVARYRELLIPRIEARPAGLAGGGEGEVFFPFHRILLWARRP